jgi:hypothetical protein
MEVFLLKSYGNQRFSLFDGKLGVRGERGKI